ncbi:MAG: alpha/beta hydrolase [Acidimicrobiales bacterium]
MASPEAQQMVEFLKALPKGEKKTLEESRAEAEAMWPAFTAEPDATFETADVGDVPAEWIRPAGCDPSRVVLYLHGGGYVQGSIASHRKLAAHISAACRSTGLIIDYRLAPEHPFPAGLDDAMTAYHWLLERGIKSKDIVVAGDSAGGGLALALALNLRDQGMELPGALVCLSPWTDLASTGDSIETNRSLDVFIEPGESEAVAWYLGDGGADVKDPLVSPLYADYSGMPRLLIQVGSHEVLLDDSTRVAEKAKAAGVDVTIEVWPEMQHVFQMVVGTIPEAGEAVAQIGTWLG